MKPFDRRRFLATTLIGGLGSSILPAFGLAAAASTMQVYKSPWCGCCGAWVEHMKNAGFTVNVTELEVLDPVKSQYKVDPELQSCHTAVIDGYVIEGHVPAREVKRLLEEKPAATGIAVPGMPVGSPGMEQGNEQEPYPVVLFAPGKRALFARY